MTRRFLRMLCRLLAGVVLLAQLAVSAYACPGLAAAETPPPAAVAQAMVNCDDMAAEPMDSVFANLCAAHCQQGQQSDQAPTLTVPVVLLTALYIKPSAPEPSLAPRPAAALTSALVAASAPRTVLHCCFRI